MTDGTSRAKRCTNQTADLYKDKRVILYLDFDGVLHSYEVYLDHRNRIYLRGMGRLFEHTERLQQALDPYPQVKIVLSTSWVRIKGFSYACKRLPLTLRERVIGATWHSQMQQDENLRNWWVNQSTRYEQIMRDVAIRQPDKWLALDDDAGGWPALASRHLVACDPQLGLGNPTTRLTLEQRLHKALQSDMTPSHNTGDAAR